MQGFRSFLSRQNTELYFCLIRWKVRIRGRKYSSRKLVNELVDKSVHMFTRCPALPFMIYALKDMAFYGIFKLYYEICMLYVL